MTTTSKRVWATINAQALRHNLAQAAVHCPDAKPIPVIKANAYGHGMIEVAKGLAGGILPVETFAVATMDEALALSNGLKELELTQSVMVLNGFINADELALCLQHGLQPVVHSPYQSDLLEQARAAGLFTGRQRFWLKLNSGMNRLGLGASAAIAMHKQLTAIADVDVVFMSHLAWADELDNPASQAFTAQQLDAFAAARRAIIDKTGKEIPCSLAASAGILAVPEAQYQYIRPGIMLYGSSPLATQTGEDIGLRPVMTLSSRLLAINELEAGDAIGYGATYICDRPTRVGVVSIGYGDGYPRAAGNGTPVLVKVGGQSIRTHLIGRVSMDMITIDLTGIDRARINDEVVLWGEGLCADEIAKEANTIAYELFCKVTPRVPRIYID